MILVHSDLNRPIGEHKWLNTIGQSLQNTFHGPVQRVVGDVPQWFQRQASSALSISLLVWNRVTGMGRVVMVFGVPSGDYEKR